MANQPGREKSDETIGADYERVISTYYGEDPVTAIINLKVDTKEVDRLATQVSDFACVEDVFLVTGETDIVVKAQFRDYRNLKDFARAMLGLARTGSLVGNGSGDFVIAFSTRNLVPYDPKPTEALRRVEELANDAMDPLFLAAVESVEEAVYNSLTKATTVTGAGGRTVEAIPIDELRELLGKR